MEQSSALHKLTEVADLVKMIEDLIAPGSIERLNASSMSGVRITLKNIRESVLASHDTLASNLVSRAKAVADVREERAAPAGENHSPVFSRNDLRASLERVIDR